MLALAVTSEIRKQNIIAHFKKSSCINAVLRRIARVAVAGDCVNIARFFRLVENRMEANAEFVKGEDIFINSFTVKGNSRDGLVGFIEASAVLFRHNSAGGSRFFDAVSAEKSIDKCVSRRGAGRADNGARYCGGFKKAFVLITHILTSRR